MTEKHDPLEDRLRAALTAEADDIEPAADGLSRIRGRIAERHKPSWWARMRDQWLTKPAFAAAASAGIIVLGLGATIGIGQASDKGFIPRILPTKSSSSSATHSAEPPNSPEPTEKTEPTKGGHSDKPSTQHTERPETVSVPVYHVTKTSDGYGVTQSSTQVKVQPGSKRDKQEQRAEGALKAIFDGGPQLRTTGAGVWQAGTSLQNADLRGGVLRVMLSSSAGNGNDTSPEAARAALKQIVYTGLGAAPSASTVQIRVGGSPVSSFWNVLTINPNGVGRGDSALTRPFNTITAPTAGSTTPAGDVKLAGSGAYDGGQVHWQLLDPGGQVLQSGTQQTGSGFADWSTSVTLTAGTYELRTYEQTSAGQNHLKSVSFTVTE